VQFLTTALSYLIARGQDQVGLALLGERLLEFIPPGCTPRSPAPRPGRRVAWRPPCDSVRASHAARRLLPASAGCFFWR
jgi:hypothetical protein